MSHESSVTIFIQGHGEELLNTPFQNVKRLSLLSFSGSPGELGNMKICDSGESIDIQTIKYLHFMYSNLYSKYNSTVTQMDIYNKLPDDLRELYKNCNIQYEDEGFTVTYPISERIFTLTPNTHENCVKCIESGSKRCIYERNSRKQLCPEYGITVLASSDPYDDGFTLATIRLEEKRTKVNWNFNPTVMKHWYGKSRYKDKGEIYNQLLNDHEITLSNLFLYFSSMGFQNIYIIDPTCRYIPHETTSFQKISRSVYEKHPSYTRNFHYSPERFHQSPMNRSLEPESNNKICTMKKNKGLLQQCCGGICKTIGLQSKSKSPSHSKSKLKHKIDGGKTRRRAKRALFVSKLKIRKINKKLFY
jgi:hypothetical protein